jgi:hypothetical protein
MRKGTAHQLNQKSRGRAFLKLAAILVVLACTASSCGPRNLADRPAASPDAPATKSLQPVSHEPRCAFADPVASTQLAICDIVAEYYVAHRQWPLTKAQLQEQIDHEFVDKSQLSAEEVHNLSTFLDQFTILDFNQHGKKLMLHYNFKADEKTVNQTVTFRPKLTSDEILRSATPD